MNTPLTIRSNPLIFLFGPTGVGKTELLQQLFTKHFAVVNADSKQIYRYMNIGSAKPEPALLQEIPHYLIDIKDPWEQFSVGAFVKLADQACLEIRDQGKVPIISGGTAYYFKQFYFGLPKSPKSDPVTRSKIAGLVKTHGLEWCYSRLQTIDPISAERIHPDDSYRITRALEVYEAAGRPLSSFSIPHKAREGMNPLIIGLTRDKAELEKRIVERVKSMFSKGLEQEIEQLMEMGAQADWPGMQGIGYREFFIAKENPDMATEDIAQLIIRNSRLYAKRQMTFFKSLPNVQWVHPDDTETLTTLAKPYL